VVKTGVGAAIDISLGRSVGWIRLPQNTVLNIDKLQAGEGKDASLDIQLTLPQGSLLGELREISESGKFEVKIPSALVGVRGGKWRIQSEGYVVLLIGTIFNVHIPQSGGPVLHKLDAPPAVYFSAAEGVRPAPPALKTEVQNQLQARLRSP
jgi:hypothetical protein